MAKANFNPRRAEQNRSVNPAHINKYHADLSIHFDTAWLEKIRQRVKDGLAKFRFTEHCKQRSAEKRIPIIPCETFILEGDCFEYKTIDDDLYRFAIKLAGKFKDYVAVFQPQLYKGQLEMVVVTYYANNKNDTHFTLRTWEYDR